MNVLILGGQSQRQKLWVRQVADALGPHFDKVVYLDYRHWGTGEADDVPYEVEQASKLAATLGDPYVIVAKSLGTTIAALGVQAGKLHPKRCVLCGFPLHLVERAMPQVPAALAALPSTTFLQNEHDPAGSYVAVHTFVAAHGNTLASVQPALGDTHDYVDFERIAELANQ